MDTNVTATQQYKDPAIYENAKERMQKVISDFERVRDETDFNRTLRACAVDVDAVKQLGKLDQDELFTPVRVADTNIRREQTHYIAYIKQSRRQMIFKSVNEPAKDLSNLESDFTTKSRYDGWEIPFFRVIDGFQTHGWDAIEVLYDDTKPGHFALRHVGHANLIFQYDAEDVQKLSMVMLRYSFSKDELIDLVRNNEFNDEEVGLVLGTGDEKTAALRLFEIYKVFFRNVEGVVQVAWALPSKCNKWLREPRQLFMGRRVPEFGPNGEVLKVTATKETEYPVVIYPYFMSEDAKITSVKGRMYFDEHTQQAVSSLLSSFVTGHRRSIQPYVSSTGEGGGEVKQTDIKTIPGLIIEGDIKFHNLPAPVPEVLNAIQALLTQNQQETSQVNYATNNRKDSRKTATEIQAAQAEANLLSSVQVALFSIAFRTTYMMCWAIYRSAVMQKLVKPQVDVNLFAADQLYNLYPAGDQDVIERQEKILRMQQAWPVVQGIPELATVFLSDLIALLFPEKAATYTQLIQQDSQKSKIISAMTEILRAVVVDPTNGELTDVAKPFANELQFILNPPQNQQGNNEAATQ